MHTPKVLASSLLLTLLALTTVVNSALDKPPALSRDFTVFEDGLLKNLPTSRISQTKTWGPGWILDDCKKAIDRANDGVNGTPNDHLSYKDVTTIEVYYADCVSPWILCHHKNSPDPVDHFFDIFGRIPVRARSHVKGMISLPTSGGSWAYYIDGFMAFLGAPGIPWYLYVQMHEMGHALDLGGAYPDKPLSSSQAWQNAYNKDSKVPDPYSQTNIIEDLAQNTVVATYDLNVPNGGLARLTRYNAGDWHTIYNQYELIKKEQKDAGNLLRPGGTCTGRLENSQPVQIPASKSRRAARRGESLPADADLDEVIDAIQAGNMTTEPYDYMNVGRVVGRANTVVTGRPNVALAEGLEVIPPHKGENICEH